jgi:hypothetical protein
MPPRPVLVALDILPPPDGARRNRSASGERYTICVPRPRSARRAPAAIRWSRGNRWSALSSSLVSSCDIILFGLPRGLPLRPQAAICNSTRRGFSARKKRPAHHQRGLPCQAGRNGAGNSQAQPPITPWHHLTAST